ncbi:MAG: hypothetical protein ABIN05_07850 [candidate division WOR-3 bacterium]
MHIRVKALLNTEIIKKETNGTWYKRIFILDTNKYMVNIFWSGIDYRPYWFKIHDTEQEAMELFNSIKNVKNVQKYLDRDKN